MSIPSNYKDLRHIPYIAGQLIRAGLSALIRIYQFAISSLLGHCCRFEPTCSNYALQAIEVHGCLKGCYLSSRRILRCHPWHAGGIDPVPQPKSTK